MNRPQTTNREMTAKVIDIKRKGSMFMDRLFPDTPVFTVVITAMFPEDLDERDVPALESYVFKVVAINVHTAIERATTNLAAMIHEDCGPEEEFVLQISAAFAGDQSDLACTFDPEQSGFAALEDAD